MKTIICVSLVLCVTLAYASALPADDLEKAGLSQPLAVPSADDDVLEGAEQRWGGRGWGGGGWGGRGWGGGWGGGRGWGGGWGGGRGWGGGWGGGRGWGGGWGR